MHKKILILIIALLVTLIIITFLVFSQEKAGIPSVIQRTPSATLSPTLSNSPTPNQLQQQSLSDRNFGVEFANLYKNYPWWDSLPLQTSLYFVFFDPKTKTFIANLYPNGSSSISIDIQVKQLKEEIINKLQKLGVETSKYEFQWQIN